jgi:hypothetical protein
LTIALTPAVLIDKTFNTITFKIPETQLQFFHKKKKEKILMIQEVLFL